jgi:GTP-binding protein EngB required for normal cell division
MNDARIAQIQQFLEPIETNDEESNKRNYATSAQTQQLFEQKEKTAEQKDVRVIQNVEMQSNEKDLQAITAQLAAENIELEKQLEHYEKQHEDELKEMEKLLAQLKAKKLNSFEDIEKQDKQAKEALIRLAKNAKPIGMEGNNIAFFGLTATGKSTMLNKLYGQNVAETGIGETTGNIKSYKTEDFILWDIPGKNDEVSYMSMEYISFFKGLTRRLILVTHTLKENSGMMKFMDAIGLNYDVVVNKMDRYDEEERPEFCAKIQEEKETIGLKGLGRIFFVSAKFPQQFPDWLDMVHYLSIPPK